MNETQVQGALASLEFIVQQLIVEVLMPQPNPKRLLSKFLDAGLERFQKLPFPSEAVRQQALLHFEATLTGIDLKIDREPDTQT